MDISLWVSAASACGPNRWDGFYGGLIGAAVAGSAVVATRRISRTERAQPKADALMEVLGEMEAIGFSPESEAILTSMRKKASALGLAFDQFIPLLPRLWQQRFQARAGAMGKAMANLKAGSLKTAEQPFSELYTETGKTRQLVKEWLQGKPISRWRPWSWNWGNWPWRQKES